MFTLKIKTVNNAFCGAGNQRYEVARILREVAAKLAGSTASVDHIAALDVNGNVVGDARLTNR